MPRLGPAKELFTEFGPTSLAHVPDQVVTWLGSARVARLVRAEFEETVALRTDGTNAAEYRRHVPVRNATADDYLLRRVSLGSGFAVLAGIHFFGGDVTRPFVGVYAQNGDASADQVGTASERLLAEFDVFAPSSTWWWRPLGRGRVGELPPHTLDQHLVVGLIGEIRRRPSPPALVSVALRRDADGATYPEYVAMFERFLDARPEWRQRGLETTSSEDYAECASAGGLYVVELEGRLCGVVAARPGVVRGVPGWEMMEEILDADVRGRRLAAHVQRRFIDHLDARRGRLVVGTIEATNEPSIRTALRVGRVEVGRWCFVHRAGVEV